MGLRDLLMQYGPPLGITALVLVLLLALAALSAGRGIAPGLWRGVRAHRTTTLLLSLALLFGVVLLTYFEKAAADERLRLRETLNLLSPTNLIGDVNFTSVGSLTSTLTSWVTNGSASEVELNRRLSAGQAITGSVITVQPGQSYRYSFYLFSTSPDDTASTAQVRLLWLDASLRVTAWDDSPQWKAIFANPPSRFQEAFHSADYEAPPGARALRMIVTNTSTDSSVGVADPEVSQEGVRVEQHPNGAEGSLAFSFDWESAMGGAIHSKGMDPHDPAGAAQHGLEMRQGADWLAKLFADNKIKATFYATGYNLLDGNTEHRQFSGNPTYKWANRKNNWATDYWLTHPWYSDDPFGTTQSTPAWYFGDQTRALLKDGHEIAPHTFGHLYVRGSNPKELSTDMDEWLSAAKAIGVPAPTTFAFPWRSSNSLTRDFYDVLYQRGIRAVTRLYAPDLKDLYTIGAVYGLNNKQPWVDADISVVPDFLLGSPSATMGEESTGAGLSAEDGLQVISRTLRTRGTTSFWQHPEQLANEPSLGGVRDTWSRVVSAAARERDNGRLWIDTVANITAYQRDVMSVTTSLDSSLFGGWKIAVDNASGKTLSGVTLTLPGDVRSATSSDVQLATVAQANGDSIRVSPAGSPSFPARQLVIGSLKPGRSTINVQWVSGQEPVR